MSVEAVNMDPNQWGGPGSRPTIGKIRTGGDRLTKGRRLPNAYAVGGALGGIASLLGMLNACSGGVVVVNIDNGFGAAMAATLINRVGQDSERGGWPITSA